MSHEPRSIRSPTPVVVLVDDEPAGRRTLETALAPLGYRCFSAANGPEALALVDEHDPDVLLLDVMMPGMDGYEVCRRLRAHARHHGLPIVLVTALDDRESRLAGIDAGADDFANKPIDRIELRTRVRAFVRMNQYRRTVLDGAPESPPGTGEPMKDRS